MTRTPATTRPQSMYARIGSKYVKMAAALSFAQPEILSLPEETLTAIVNDPAVADYKFNLEDLLRGKPHTLTKAEGKAAGQLWRGHVCAVRDLPQSGGRRPAV